MAGRGALIPDVVVYRATNHEYLVPPNRKMENATHEMVERWNAQKQHIDRGCVRSQSEHATTKGTRALFQDYLTHLQSGNQGESPISDMSNQAYQALFNTNGVNVRWDANQATNCMTIEILHDEEEEGNAGSGAGSDYSFVKHIVICPEADIARLQGTQRDRATTFYFASTKATDQVFRQIIGHIRHVVYGPGFGCSPCNPLNINPYSSSPHLPSSPTHNHLPQSPTCQPIAPLPPSSCAAGVGLEDLLPHSFARKEYYECWINDQVLKINKAAEKTQTYLAPAQNHFKGITQFISMTDNEKKFKPETVRTLISQIKTAISNTQKLKKEADTLSTTITANLNNNNHLETNMTYLTRLSVMLREAEKLAQQAALAHDEVFSKRMQVLYQQ